MTTDKPERPALAVDAAVFAVRRGCLAVLIHRRDHEPYAGAPALPGVALLPDESLIAAARRSLKEKAGWSETDSEQIYLEQVAAFDSLYRDPRGRTISIAYMGVTHHPSLKSEQTDWLNVYDISDKDLPFDHYEILQTAVRQLKRKLKHSNIAKGFLSETFRIEELQEIYEAILTYPIHRTNFRNKLLKSGVIEHIRTLTDAVGKKGGRPPHLYRFTHNGIKATERDIL